MLTTGSNINIYNPTDSSLDLALARIDFNELSDAPKYEQVVTTTSIDESEATYQNTSPTNDNMETVVSIKIHSTNKPTAKAKGHKSHLICAHIFRAIFIRSLFIAQSLIYILFILCQTNSMHLIALSAPLFVIVVDGFYVCIRRKGCEIYSY